MIKKLWPLIVREPEYLVDGVVTQWILLPYCEYEVDKEIKDMTKDEILGRHEVQVLEEMYYYDGEATDKEGQHQHQSFEMIKLPLHSEVWYRKVKDGTSEDGFEVALEARLIEGYEVTDAYIFESSEDAKGKLQELLCL
jgi:hypothetical protein